MVNKQMSRNNNKYSLIALKIFIVIIFIFSTFFYGCRGKKAILFWEDKYYYDITGVKEAISNSADKNLDNVTELSTPIFKSNLLIIVPSREMANWAKGEKHHSNEAVGIILETGLHMYASAIKKHNMFKTVVIISSDDRTTDRTLFDYTMYVDGLEPRTDSPIWVINNIEYDIEMPFQFATVDFFTSESLNEAVNNLKNTFNKIDEIISSINEYKTIEKFLK
jgi:hypothetical protein